MGLNYGCGERLLRGVINCDSTQPSAFTSECTFLKHSATDPLPFPDDSFEFVFSQHFVEHLPLKDAITWLTEVRRVLKPKGVVRLSTPDLKRHCAAYLSGDSAFRAKNDSYLSQWMPLPPNRPAWRLNQIFQFWGHAWLYDREELIYLAERAGFHSVTFPEFGQSRDARLGSFDSPDRQWESLYVEMYDEGPRSVTL